ncbi:MAG: PA0069 family radical SAM protein [Gammaproteobacteria bacterium]|nr:PA0069 family radical SAM protein [Gammaproteobacteria bacterium]
MNPAETLRRALERRGSSDAPAHPPRKGRGAVSNESGRYEALSREAFDDGWNTQDESPAPLRTSLTPDSSRTIISRNQSPDIPFECSINPYRGCEHGCVYCYARPTHAWLGLSPGLDFESKLFFKPNAAEQLKRELGLPSYRCTPIALGANTDPYQPSERRLEITRSILKVLSECEHPVRIVTKGALVERDIDLLAPMAERSLCAVSVSVTTLDRRLSRLMEPRAAAPERRIRTVKNLSDAGIPVNVLVAPIIPVLTDREIELILGEVREAGARSANYVLLRLPLEIKDLFVDWLNTHFPLKAEHVIKRIRDTRGGKTNDAAFGLRQRGSGEYAELISRRFSLALKRLGFPGDVELDTSRFRPPSVSNQLPLF